MNYLDPNLNTKLLDCVTLDKTSITTASLTGVRPSVFIKTFGCQMNDYDSEKMLSLLQKTHDITDAPEKADVIIVNTCSVREKAEHKLYSLLGTFVELKQSRPELIVGVSGCVAQQEGKTILKRSRLVNFVVGTHNLSLVPSLVERAKAGFPPQVVVDYREEWDTLPDEFLSLPRASEIDGALPASSFGVFASPVRALVAIQRGCSKNCAFCVVPHTRGPEVSRAPDEIEREVRLKVRQGAKEVFLLGQTVNSYGKDLSPRYSFEKLIRRLAEIEGVLRIRFTSPHPAEVRPQFIGLYGDIPQLVPHIHLPLQSGSDRILRLMNRNYRLKRYLEIIDSIRARVPDIAITSDFIVGFPTESDEDFEATLNVIRGVRYSAAFSFAYSGRPNTKALQVFNDSEFVTKAVAKSRLKQLQTLQNEISGEINKRKIGSYVDVLVESPANSLSSRVRGRTPENIMVEFEGSDAKLGETLSVLVTRSSPYCLYGEKVTAID